MVNIFFISTSILLLGLKLIYPGDFPAYVIAIPLMIMALMQGLIYTAYRLHFIFNVHKFQRLSLATRPRSQDLYGRLIQRRNQDGGEIIDITKLLEQRRKQNQGDDNEPA